MASAYLLSFILDNMEEFQIHTYAVWTQKKNMTCIWQMLTLLSKKGGGQCRPGLHKYWAAVYGVSNMEFAACQPSDT